MASKKTALLAGVSASANTAFMVDPAVIHVSPAYNFRDAFDPENDAEDAELLASIGEIGITTPIGVRFDGDKVILVRGHRRLAAVKMLAARGAVIKRIDAVKVMAENDAELTLDLLTSNNGKHLTILERGGIFAKLRAYKWTDKEIGAKAGVDPRYVLQCIASAKLDPRMKAYIKSGAISATLALETVAKQGEAKAIEVVNTAVTDAKAAGAVASKGKGLATAPAIAAAAAKVPGAKPQPPKSAPKGKATAPVVTATTKPETATVRVAQDPKGAVLKGPFVREELDIMDGNRASILTCESQAIAITVCAWMNACALSLASPMGVAKAMIANATPAAAELAKVPAATVPAATMPVPVKRKTDAVLPTNA